MKKLYILIAAVFGFFNLSNSQDFPSTLAIDLQTALDAHISSTNNKGIAATVILANDMEWTGSSGISSGNSPIDTSKLFNFGSQGKLLTTVTLMKMQEEGLLSVDDSIGKYLPDLKNIRTDFSIKRFMNHTSGAEDYWKINEGAWGDVWSNREAIWTLEEAAAYIPASNMDPDPQYNYTNTNTLVLALLVEKITGNTFGEEINNRILKPLNINSSVFPDSNFDESLLNGIWSYNSNNPQDRSTWQHDSYLTSRVAWIGKIYETARFNRALHQGNVLSTSNTEFLYTEAPGSQETIDFPRIGIERSYGYSVEILNYNGQNMHGHAGNGINFSMTYHFTEENYTIAIVSNVFDTYVEMAQLFDDLYSIVQLYESETTEVESRAFNHSINIYPNPATDVLNIRLKDIYSKNLSVSILDMSGRMIKQYNYQNFDSQNEITLQISIPEDIQRGYYFLRMNDGEKVITKPFILAR